MCSPRIAAVIASLLIVVATTGQRAEGRSEGSVVLLLDNSGSMGSGQISGSSKTEEARQAIRNQFIPSLPDGIGASLATFGGACRTLETWGPQRTKRSELVSDVNRTRGPGGGTPLAWAMEESLRRLKRLPSPRHLIVVTDGLDTCGGDPCAVVRAAARDGIQFSVHTIGVDMRASDAAFRVLRCAADETPNGSSSPLSDVREIGSRLVDVAGSLGEPEGELVVRLLDADGTYRDGVPFTARSVDRTEVYRGRSGEPLTLPVGEYDVEGGAGMSGRVLVGQGDEALLEVRSPLGEVKILGACDDGLSYSLLDSRERVVSSGELAGDRSLVLQPGAYKLALNQFPGLEPVDFVVERNGIVEVELPGVGEMTVVLDSEVDGSDSLRIEIYDDLDSQRKLPIATGEIGRPFRLPAGVFNVAVASDAGLASKFGHASNVEVDACGTATVVLGPGASVFVCGKGRVELWPEPRGEVVAVAAGVEVAVRPGQYNVVLPSGRVLANMVIGEGLTRIACQN